MLNDLKPRMVAKQLVAGLIPLNQNRKAGSLRSASSQDFKEVFVKTQALRIFSMMSFLVMLAAVTVQADPPRGVRADIPFDFIVGNKTYPAGSYAVEYTQPQGAFLIHIAEDESRRTLLWSNTVPAQSIEDHSPKLIFNRYGDEYFLTQVWRGGDLDGRELRKFHRELERAREYFAKNVSAPEVVYVAALQSVPVGSAAIAPEQTSDPIKADRS
ncbi:MAG: hypothetical protein O7A06_00305 [Acidobacteria bacterium]|nr:hypothetical protein [Acidobacteriota bacterium]